MGLRGQGWNTTQRRDAPTKPTSIRHDGTLRFEQLRTLSAVVMGRMDGQSETEGSATHGGGAMISSAQTGNDIVIGH